MGRFAGVAVLLCCVSCGTKAVKTRTARTDCAPLLAKRAAWMESGYLGRALDVAEQAFERCPSSDTRDALADSLAALWLRDPLEKLIADAPTLDDADRGRLTALLEETKAVDGGSSRDEQKTAIALYRDGVDQRLRNKPDLEASLHQLEKSFRLAPHPLTLIQIALTHKVAARLVEYRKFTARALAMAEHSQKTRAVPFLIEGHAGDIVDVDLSASGRVLVTADASTVRVWDVSTRRPRRTIAVGGGILRVALSEDAGQLAVLAGKRLLVYDAQNGAKLDERRATPMHDIALLGAWDGRFVAVTAPDEVLREMHGGGFMTVDKNTNWASPNSKYKYWWVPQTSEIGRARAMRSDGLIAIAREETGPFEVRGLGPVSGELLFPVDVPTGIQAMAFDAKSSLAAESSSGVLRVWNLTNGNLANLDVPPGPARLAFQPDGSRLAVAAGDDLGIWDTNTLKLVHSFRAESSITSLRYSSNGDRMAVASGHSVVILDRKARLVGPMAGAQSEALTLDVDDDLVAVGQSDGRVIVWDLANGTRTATLRVAGASIPAVAFCAPDAVMAGTGEGAAHIWNRRNGTAVHDRRAIDNTRALAAHGPTKRLAVTGSDNVVRIFSAIDDTPAVELRGHAMQVTAAAFSQDGRHLATVSDDSSIRVWDASSGNPIAVEFTEATKLTAVAWHASGQYIAVGGNDGSINVLALPKLRNVGRFDTHDGWITALAFGKEHTLIASVSRNNRVDIRELGSDSARVVLDHPADITALRFAGDSASLFTTAKDGALRVWNATSGALKATYVSRGKRWAGLGEDGRVAGASDLVGWRVGKLELPGFVGWQRYGPED